MHLLTALPTDDTHAVPEHEVPEVAMPSRRQRATALAADAALGGAALLGGGTVALAWWLVVTGAGAADLTTPEATVGWAVILATVPAWLTVLGATGARGATPGQRLAGLEVAGTPRRRLLRLALHPIGVAGWTWGAVLFALVGLAIPSLLAWGVALGVATAAVVSATLVLLDPAARGVHDRLAGTSLVATHPSRTERAP